MKDRVPLNPGRVLIAPEDGSESFYATLIRADNPRQEGDPLNKTTLLQDETAGLFGLDHDAVPDDVFKTIDSKIRLLSGRAAWVFGTYTGDGLYGASNLSTLTFDGIVHMVIISGYTDQTVEPMEPLVAIKGAIVSASTDSLINISWQSNSFTRYSTTAKAQFNVEGYTYQYAALVEKPNYSGVATLYLQTEDGTPVVGASVYNLWDEQANTNLLTDSEGKVSGYANSGGDVAVTAQEIDLAKTKATIERMTDGAVTQTIVIPYVEDGTIVEITESGSVKFASSDTTVDVCCVGAGGGGGTPYIYNDGDWVYAIASGGGGGNITNAYGLTVTAGEAYTAEIGAGGAPGAAERNAVDGSTGGTTSFMGVSATGGGGGTGYYGIPSSVGYGSGGGTSTNGGAGGSCSTIRATTTEEGLKERENTAAGKASTEFPFGDSSLQVSGGGGGAIHYYNLDQSNSLTGGPGGAAFGCYGAANFGGESSRNKPETPRGAGGGGGGGACTSSTSAVYTTNGGYGADGAVFVRMHRG